MKVPCLNTDNTRRTHGSNKEKQNAMTSLLITTPTLAKFEGRKEFSEKPKQFRPHVLSTHSSQSNLCRTVFPILPNHVSVCQTPHSPLSKSRAT